MVDHSRLSKRKKSGGRKRASKGKRKVNRGSLPTMTNIDEKKSKKKRLMGGSIKRKVLQLLEANVLDPKTNKCKKVKIIKEISNAADRNFPRRGILTKGAVIETEIGEAVITSRPSKHGAVNAVLKK